MADNRGLIILVLVALFLFGQGDKSTVPTGDDGTPIITQCAYAPTVQLGANDKYAGGQTNWGSWRYKLNGGATTTDSDGSFEVQKGSGLQVLVADANSSTYYRSLWTPTISECGINSLEYPDVIRYTTFEAKCYNDEGDAMNGTTYARNLTIGTGGSRTVKCEVTGVADYGMPHGGVMVAEFNQTTFVESTMDVQWEGSVAPEVSTPDTYTVALAGATTKAWDIPGFEDVGTREFFITLQAESTIDPGGKGGATTTSYGNDVILRVYPKNCFEEEDVTPSEFKCEVEDIDDTFTSPGGTAKAGAAAITIIIPVD